jgi:hypothetical protein
VTLPVTREKEELQAGTDTCPPLTKQETLVLPALQATTRTLGNSGLPGGPELLAWVCTYLCVGVTHFHSWGHFFTR